MRHQQLILCNIRPSWHNMRLKSSIIRNSSSVCWCLSWIFSISRFCECKEHILTHSWSTHILYKTMLEGRVGQWFVSAFDTALSDISLMCLSYKVTFRTLICFVCCYCWHDCFVLQSCLIWRVPYPVQFGQQISVRACVRACVHVCMYVCMYVWNKRLKQYHAIKWQSSLAVVINT
jgi:hypothetical protein